MRTIEEIKSYLDSKYHPYWLSENNQPIDFTRANSCIVDLDSTQYKYELRWHFGDLQKVLNEVLVKLWNDEEIVSIEIFNEIITGSPYCLMLLLTSRNRMFDCKQTFCESRYFYGVGVCELNHVDVNKCRILEVENRTWLGKLKPPIYGQLVLNDQYVFKQIHLTVLRNVYNTIINHINEYKVEKVIKVVAEQQPNSKASSSVDEIRKLFEDGIISKEEMLDLIKETLKK